MAPIAFSLIMLAGLAGSALAHVTGTDHVHTPDQVIEFDHPVEPTEAMVIEKE